MNRLRIVYDNVLDDATLSASPALAATLPEDNLKTVCRSSVARTTSTAAQAILGTFSVSKLSSAFVLWRHNLTSDATVRLQLYSLANQTGTIVYDSGAIAPYDGKRLGDLNWGLDGLGDSVFSTWGVFWTVMWYPPTVFRSFRITITDSSNPAGYMEISRGLLGPYIEPTFNPIYGMSLAWDEDAVQERTDGGTLHTDPATPFRVLELNLRDLDESARPKFFEMTRQVGERNEFFISVYPEEGGEKERDHSMLGKLSGVSPLSTPYFSSYSQTMRVLEV